MQSIATKSTNRSCETPSGAPLAFRYRQNIGKARHVVCHHDGHKTHGDGSPFFDITIFSRKTEAEKYIRSLCQNGYVEN